MYFRDTTNTTAQNVVQILGLSFGMLFSVKGKKKPYIHPKINYLIN